MNIPTPRETLVDFLRFAMNEWMYLKINGAAQHTKDL